MVVGQVRKVHSDHGMVLPWLPETPCWVKDHFPETAHFSCLLPAAGRGYKLHRLSYWSQIALCGHLTQAVHYPLWIYHAWNGESISSKIISLKKHSSDTRSIRGRDIMAGRGGSWLLKASCLKPTHRYPRILASLHSFNKYVLSASFMTVSLPYMLWNKETNFLPSEIQERNY